MPKLANKCQRCAEDRRAGLIAVCKRLEREHPTWSADRLVAEAKAEWIRKRVPMQIVSGRLDGL